MLNKKLAVLALAIAGASLAGCSGGAAKVDDQGTSTSGADASEISMKNLDNPNSPLYKKVFYFEFDSSEVAAADKPNVTAHAKLLASNPGTNVTVEGHCDERGTREYNLALGERRGKSVANMLTLQGASRNQVRVVSYGEERPAASCHDESCWSQNRRAELKYPGR